MKKCKNCGNDLPKGRRSFCCDECFKIHRKNYIEKRNFNRVQVYKWRKDRKILAINFKGGSCIICGYNKCSSALEFHHKIPSEKDFSISENYNKKFEHLKCELRKCVLVCSNCHREIHDGMINTELFLQNDINNEYITFVKKIPIPRKQRKIKKKYFCVDCGKEIYRNVKRCIECQNISQRKVERPPYDQLIKEIDELGYCGVGRKYGVSDNAIRKWKKTYEKYGI